MCLAPVPFRHAPRVNYDGGVIIHRCIVPSGRPVVGRRTRYAVDIRSFLDAENNALIRETIVSDIRAMLDAQDRAAPMPGRWRGTHASRWEVFLSRDRGAFDYRVQAIAEFVARRIRYVRTGSRDVWQYPDETLALRSGDCEDRAFLLASLLRASGISGYNIRVAIGRVFQTRPGRRPRAYDHVWVMYKNELGVWTPIEPVYEPDAGAPAPARRPHPSRAMPVTYCYEPAFLFNDAHLWCMRPEDLDRFQDVMTLREQWERIDPSFAGDVHHSIVSSVFDPYGGAYDAIRDGLLREFVSLPIVNRAVDGIDMPWLYHPFDHFDSAYIDESWSRVRSRLESCARPGTPDALHLFALAAHGIADFYAHSTYAHFARRSGTQMDLAMNEAWAPAALASPPEYGPTGGIPFQRFPAHPEWHGTDAQRAGLWNGALISGRYAFPGDNDGLLPGLTPFPDDLERRADYANRLALPHHDTIAVDDFPVHGKSSPLYQDPASYRLQFQLRYDAAIRHIRQSFETYGDELRKL